MNTILSIDRDIKTLEVTSSAFKNGNSIPKKYTCDGYNVNPPLLIEKIPESAKSLVVIVEDPDAPVRAWTHWLVWNIIPIKHIKENSAPGKQGTTDFRLQKYSGPCPPSGTHHYHFKVYALDDLLNLNQSATKHDLEKVMASHIISFGELIGTYQRL